MTTRRHNPEDLDLNLHPQEKLKSRIETCTSKFHAGYGVKRFLK